MNESIARGRYEVGGNGGIQGEDARWFQLCWFLSARFAAGTGISTVVCQVGLVFEGRSTMLIRGKDEQLRVKDK